MRRDTKLRAACRDGSTRLGCRDVRMPPPNCGGWVASILADKGRTGQVAPRFGAAHKPQGIIVGRRFRGQVEPRTDCADQARSCTQHPSPCCRVTALVSSAADGRAWYDRPMTKLLEQAIKAIRRLPAKRQDELAAAMLEATKPSPGGYTGAQLAAIDEGIADADAGLLCRTKTLRGFLPAIVLHETQTHHTGRTRPRKSCGIERFRPTLSQFCFPIGEANQRRNDRRAMPPHRPRLVRRRAPANREPEGTGDFCANSCAKPSTVSRYAHRTFT